MTDHITAVREALEYAFQQAVLGPTFSDEQRYAEALTHLDAIENAPTDGFSSSSKQVQIEPVDAPTDRVSTISAEEVNATYREIIQKLDERDKLLIGPLMAIISLDEDDGIFFARHVAKQALERWNEETPSKQEAAKSAGQPDGWAYCPECGSDQFKIGHNASPNEHECRKCGQSWWPDVDYTEAVRKNLAEQRSKLESGEPPFIVLAPQESDEAILHFFRAGFNIVINRPLPTKRESCLDEKHLSNDEGSK